MYFDSSFSNAILEEVEAWVEIQIEIERDLLRFFLP